MSQTRITYDGVPFIITEKPVYDCHQGTDRHAADKARRKNAEVTNTGFFFYFYSSDFLRGHVHE